MAKIVYSVFLAYSLVSINCGLRTHYMTFLNSFISFVKLLGLSYLSSKTSTNHSIHFSFCDIHLIRVLEPDSFSSLLIDIEPLYRVTPSLLSRAFTIYYWAHGLIF